MVNNTQHIVEVDNLVKKFGDFTANDHLSFTVKKGEIFGFLGANGAGKTTAIKMLCGLSSPTSGHMKVAGYDGYTQRGQIKKNIGYMSQMFSLYEDLNIRENIKFYAGIYGLSRKAIKQRTDDLVERLQLGDIQHKLIKELPLGWRQKLAFSVAVFHRPQIVFLDEPTSGVDPITRRQFWEMIYETSQEGITAFVTTHYMDEAEYCDRACIMATGQICALDTPGTLKKQYEVTTMNEVFVKLTRNQ